MERALRYCDLAVSKGLLAIRTHVDICDDRLTAVDALLEVKKTIAPYIDLQLVAFPQDGYFRSPTAAKNLERALDKGVDVVGGIPHFERTMADGAGEPEGALRDRRKARAAGRHPLRRDRRPAVAPHRGARLRDAAARPAGPRRRLAPHLHALHGQLLRLKTAAADRRGRRARDPQPADQHRAAGPPRHLSEAPRHDARAGDARPRHQRRLRPGLHHGPLVFAGRRRHARRRAYGPARRADDEPRGDALLLRGGDDERRHASCSSTAMASRSATTPTWWCCRRTTRSRRSGCAPGASSSSAAAR